LARPSRCKAASVMQLLFLEAPPFPLSSRPKAVMALRPTECDENSFCPATTLPESHPFPLVIRPERSVVGGPAVQRLSLGDVFRQSVPGFPTSRRQQRPRGRISVKRAARRSLTPRVSTGNSGERSGEISVWMHSLGNAFNRAPHVLQYREKMPPAKIVSAAIEDGYARASRDIASGTINAWRSLGANFVPSVIDTGKASCQDGNYLEHRLCGNPAPCRAQRCHEQRGAAI